MGYNISADHLLLHTIQTEEAFEELLSTGVLVPDRSRSEPLYAEAYDWMFRQMAARLASVGEGAIWFWAQTRRQELVDSCRRAAGDVLLTCRVPRERVLLSHFVDWHAVLNRYPIVPVLPGESDDAYDARLDRVFDDFHAKMRSAGLRDAGLEFWPDDLRNELEQSWEFALDPVNYGRFEAWQGTMHVLGKEDLVEAVRIQC
jgi:hypothetical protein